MNKADVLRINRAMAGVFEYAKVEGGVCLVRGADEVALGYVEYRKPGMWMAWCYGTAQDVGIATLHPSASDAAEAVVLLAEGQEPPWPCVVADFGSKRRQRKSRDNPVRFYYPGDGDMSVINLIKKAVRIERTLTGASLAPLNKNPYSPVSQVADSTAPAVRPPGERASGRVLVG